MKSSILARRMAKITGLVDRFGQPEILDDLIDGWVASTHKGKLIQIIYIMETRRQSGALNVLVLIAVLHCIAMCRGAGGVYSYDARHCPGQRYQSDHRVRRCPCCWGWKAVQ